MTGEAAVTLALDVRQPAAGGRDTVTLTAVGTYEAAAALPGTLTPRECQVAALVAGGHSNKAIAEELFISPATAARHVANILAKLGFSSRTQIAAWAAAKQLGQGVPAAPDRRTLRGAGRAGHLRTDTRRGLPEPGVILAAHLDRPLSRAGGRRP